MDYHIMKLIYFFKLCLLVNFAQPNETNSFNDTRRQLRVPQGTPESQGFEPDRQEGFEMPEPNKPGKASGGAKEQQNRFSTRSTTRRRFMRTTPLRISFKENCDYLAHYCLKAYTTGKLCGRTLYYTYHTFKNYCLLDYVNCMERYEVWQVVHMGECFNVAVLTEYLLYPYDDDYFLDQYYILEDH